MANDGHWFYNSSSLGHKWLATSVLTICVNKVRPLQKICASAVHLELIPHPCGYSRWRCDDLQNMGANFRSGTACPTYLQYQPILTISSLHIVLRSNVMRCTHHFITLGGEHKGLSHHNHLHYQPFGSINWSPYIHLVNQCGFINHSQRPRKQQGTKRTMALQTIGSLAWANLLSKKLPSIAMHWMDPFTYFYPWLHKSGRLAPIFCWCPCQVTSAYLLSGQSGHAVRQASMHILINSIHFRVFVIIGLTHHQLLGELSLSRHSVSLESFVVCVHASRKRSVGWTVVQWFVPVLASRAE